MRVLLEYSQLVRTQMGAILRLSQEHPVRVLIPMVTLEDDIRKMREAFDATERRAKDHTVRPSSARWSKHRPRHWRFPRS